MTFAELVRKLSIDTAPYAEIGMHDFIFFKKEADLCAIMYDTSKIPKLSHHALLIAAESKKAEFLMQLETLVTTQLFGKGPKIFRPTAYQLSMLEKMTLSLEVQDFHMPFETIIVELPDEYVDSKMSIAPGQDRINIAVLHHKNGVFIHNVWQCGTVVKSWWAPDPTDMLETWLDMNYAKHSLHKETEFVATEEEFNIEMQVRRAVLNYCLLLDEVGIKKEGPASPNQYAQLVKWCQKQNKHTKKNKLDLQAQPMIYQLAKQEIELVREIAEPHKAGGHTGRKMSPHSRRGHYRMQRFGPGLSEKKRIRIPFTIINKHLLDGPPPVAEYKT